MNTTRNHYEVERTLTNPHILKANELIAGDLIYGKLVSVGSVNLQGKEVDTFAFQLEEDFVYQGNNMRAGSLVQLTGAAFSSIFREGKLTLDKTYALHFMGKIQLKDGRPFTQWSIQQLKVTAKQSEATPVEEVDFGLED